MALGGDSHYVPLGKIMKFEMWGTTTPSYAYPLEGILDVSLLRKRQVITQDAHGLVIDIAEYIEDHTLPRVVAPVPLTFLRRPRLLQTSVEVTLADLNVDLVFIQDIAQGISSHVYNTVGGYMKVFSVIAVVEITKVVVVRQAPDLGMLLQDEPCGASREALQKLKEMSFSDPKVADVGTCAICLEDLSQGDDEKRLISMPCDHLFHDSCIFNWLDRSRICPLCRRELS
ncbi:E3 ubiquitin-protein ligase SDIR1-like isoform X2 [Punica granatum]|nr:E3 ubiquitin-protein ligase SDIR1-like isoform X2 [Punica granatum]XP_031378209.1 E3 ubiquitin-protein ligase SDIR1-like isoform X2 [Punica granatum]XP_031378210.1 E3 ubiquitin-protein ligase SDIR1-like isoform X2 [Punica granatum]XP_031378211.1 E3 ubiquitin-protein ligase SDIR1-like isoform X2 [Punica granatum]OWM87903.1 hypothetical protein CDL15_Pgr000320 [Punica granatum]PKI73805.1 hypothetical protein CRG98_005789 [Punica granatum]